MSAKKVCLFLFLRNRLNFYSKRPYYTYSELRKKRCLFGFHKACTLSNCASQNVSSLPSVANEAKQLLHEFPEPKKILWRLINEAYFADKSLDVRPIFIEDKKLCVTTKQNLWYYRIYMKWPVTFHVEGVSSKKNEAETLAYLYACQKMKGFSLLDNCNNPLLSKKESNFNETVKTAKGELLNLYHRLSMMHCKHPEYMPKFEKILEDGVIGNEKYWKCVLHLQYPEKKSFESCAKRVGEAEGIAAAKALLWLKEVQIINNKQRLIRYSKEEETKLCNNHLAPYSICIPSQLQEKMSSVLHRWDEMVKEEKCLPSFENYSVNDDNSSKLNEIQIRNIITDEMYHELSEEEHVMRSHQMLAKNISHFENSDPSVQEIRKITSSLPIVSYKEAILRLVDENQVVVISGETGSGKTTQVPQYLLDHYIEKIKGASCNIVVTQPRRISAISIAERIAHERGEQVGETVGYHVRLNKNLPKQSGAMLFCSTGMLLRKLCFNPNLDGISHVIVDEVHERSIQVEILLILLKRLLESNKNIKILIMSASFNPYIFSRYFNNCPVLSVRGNVYPVKEHFLESLPFDLVGVNNRSKTGPVLDVNLVANVLNYVHTTQKSGAILCFLPGWHDILTVQNKLLEICKDPSKLKICCAHSRLPHEEQKLIFERVPDGIRKVILATNIAETSITINDVVYVVDSGLQKGTTFDGERGVPSLGTQWITKANVRQRTGRAGRVQHGVCYHLFPTETFTDMDDYPLPEMLRMPLESVILDCKLYCPDSKAEDFLSTALQPPDQKSLQIGVSELQMCGVLDENERLTDLGKVIVNFATHPRLSIALVYASFLRCLDPVLTICAMLTLSKEPFLNTLEDISLIKMIKQCYDNFLFSDHLAMSKIFDMWQKLNGSSEAENFIVKNLLDEQNLNFAKDLKSLFAESLFEAGIIDSADAFLNLENKCNFNHDHFPSVFAVLSAAFYPNAMKIIQGDISHGRINKDAVIYSLVKGQRGYIQRESVASKEYELPSPWLVYFKALHSEARRLMMTSAVSVVPGVCLLLFGGQQLTVVGEEENDPNRVILRLDDYEKLIFSCTKNEAELLMNCRNHLRNIFKTYVQSLNSQNNDKVPLYSEEFLPLLKEIISIPQVPFTKGQLYKFVNNELRSEEV